MEQLKIAVLISGRGSNLEALIDLRKSPGSQIDIVSVISNNPAARGLTKAKNAGITTEIIDHTEYESREAFEKDLDSAIRCHNANFICNAGFMRILTSEFVYRWFNRQLNIHPSLLPAYPGLNTHGRVIADGVRFTGCTVHFVRAKLDAGPIIIQASIPVLPGDTPTTLGARVLSVEHKIYPMAVRLIAEGRVQVEEEQVNIRDSAAPNTIQVNPTLE